ncbi:exopolysaccharide biosynthesis protein [Labrenzia sp. CE80]|uniref:exopolysaccharide biosynthesis protein n=1 Tax=Labrenzia sp. CE80 TaxID=1788986 RepID=UPI00129C0967
MTKPPISRVVTFLGIALALAVFHASPVPTTTARPDGAIALLSLGLLTRDSLVKLAGLPATGVAVYLLFLRSRSMVALHVR